MTTIAKSKAPIVAATTTGASVSEPHDFGRETAPFDIATDTGDSVADGIDVFARGRCAVQGA